MDLLKYIISPAGQVTIFGTLMLIWILRDVKPKMLSGFLQSGDSIIDHITNHWLLDAIYKLVHSIVGILMMFLVPITFIALLWPVIVLIMGVNYALNGHQYLRTFSDWMITLSYVGFIIGFIYRLGKQAGQREAVRDNYATLRACSQSQAHRNRK